MELTARSRERSSTRERDQEEGLVDEVDILSNESEYKEEEPTVLIAERKSEPNDIEMDKENLESDKEAEQANEPAITEEPFYDRDISEDRESISPRRQSSREQSPRIQTPRDSPMGHSSREQSPSGNTPQDYPSREQTPHPQSPKDSPRVQSREPSINSTSPRGHSPRESREQTPEQPTVEYEQSPTEMERQFSPVRYVHGNLIYLHSTVLGILEWRSTKKQ